MIRSIQLATHLPRYECCCFCCPCCCCCDSTKWTEAQTELCLSSLLIILKENKRGPRAGKRKHDRWPTFCQEWRTMTVPLWSLFMTVVNLYEQMCVRGGAEKERLKFGGKKLLCVDFIKDSWNTNRFEDGKYYEYKARNIDAFSSGLRSFFLFLFPVGDLVSDLDRLKVRWEMDRKKSVQGGFYISCFAFLERLQTVA